MKKRNAGMMLSFIIATLVLAVGYALVTDIPLSVSGTASAGASNENFDVQMVADSLVYTGTTQTVNVEDNTTSNEKQLNVNFTASGFTAKGDKAVVTYTIENQSNDLDAALSSTGVKVTIPENTDNITYYAEAASLFDTSYYFNNTEETKTITIGSEDGLNTTTVTVVITLNKTILDEENVAVNINLPINANAR